MLTGLLATLAGNGLGLLVDAITAKGKDFVQEKLGVDLEKTAQTPEGIAKLKELEFEHEETLLKLALEEKKLDHDLIKHDKKQITKRWESDNKSGSWIAKNVRPASFGLWTVFLCVIIFLDGRGLNIKDAWIPVVQTIYIAYLGAYIGSVAVEKIKKVR